MKPATQKTPLKVCWTKKIGPFTMKKNMKPFSDLGGARLYHLLGDDPWQTGPEPATPDFGFRDSGTQETVRKPWNSIELIQIHIS